MLHWLRYGAGWWLGLLPLYLLLAGSLDGQEVSAAIVLSSIAALAATATRFAGNLHYQPHWHWLRHLRRLPRQLFADSFLVGIALARALLRREKIEGSFRFIPFDPGGEDPESAARRALVLAGLCLTPNTYVVALESERGRLVVHQLVPSAQPPGAGNREWPL